MRRKIVIDKKWCSSDDSNQWNAEYNWRNNDSEESHNLSLLSNKENKPLVITIDMICTGFVQDSYLIKMANQSHSKGGVTEYCECLLWQLCNYQW